MKISTKCISGYGFLIVLMIAVLGYQLDSFRRMELINKGLAEINFQAALTSVQLIKDGDLVELDAKKFFLVGGQPFITLYDDSKANFEASLQTIKSLGKTQQEQVEIDRLSRFWEEFLEAAARQQREAPPKGLKELPPALVEQLERVRTQTQSVYKATLQSIESERKKAAETGERAKWFSYSAAVAALVLSCLVSVLIVRSIAEPLTNLTEGTRAIAQGKFFYRLDTSRNDEYSQLAKDFNTMIQRLNELDQMKKDFVSHVSHELKAPLASMQETIHLMLEELPGPLSEKQRRLLQLNLQSGRRLSTMIGNLLDLSRMEAGVMEYELKIRDLGILVRTAITEFEAHAREKDLRIEMDIPETSLMVECDGDRIIQVVGNLIGNAIKFSPSSAAIRVHMDVTSEVPVKMPQLWLKELSGNNHGSLFARVSISDSGPGVPEPHKEKIFAKFHQVRQGKKIPGQGVGLGLAICRTIVEAHRGAIWVEDNPEGGSTFVLLLRAGASEHGVTYSASSPI